MMEEFSFIVVLLIVAEGSSSMVHLGGNTTLPCSIKDDREINWIITDGNQTFIRIMSVENNYGPEFELEPTNIHPHYFGRIRSVSSSTNTHSLLLLNITEDDLLLFCCTEYTLQQTHCTKLDYKQVSTEDADFFSPDAVLICPWLPAMCVLLLLLLLSTVCVCWRAAEMQKGCGTTHDLSHQEWMLKNVQLVYTVAMKVQCLQANGMQEIEIGRGGQKTKRALRLKPGGCGRKRERCRPEAVDQSRQTVIGPISAD
ncbi:uncharacterized protein [Danio rerio]|uniref:Uncharacterized protein n=1 Tax=Danio rerio TaxID=7955 RepID=A0AC58IRV9_DANRE